MNLIKKILINSLLFLFLFSCNVIEVKKTIVIKEFPTIIVPKNITLQEALELLTKYYINSQISFKDLKRECELKNIEIIFIE